VQLPSLFFSAGKANRQMAVHGSSCMPQLVTAHMHKTTSQARISAPDLSQAKYERVKEPCDCPSMGDAKNNQNQEPRDPPKDFVHEDSRPTTLVADLNLEGFPTGSSPHPSPPCTTRRIHQNTTFLPTTIAIVSSERHLSGTNFVPNFVFDILAS
jgi:hypothetical protein